jgi:hypothetical protein
MFIEFCFPVRSQRERMEFRSMCPAMANGRKIEIERERVAAGVISSGFSGRN